MAQPFLRIDLANHAKDFQNVVIEAGWPLIDKANANYQILRKWLGEAVAEPERKGEEIVFYLRNESGARIDHPVVKKVSDKELSGVFKGELQALLKTLQTAEPKNSAEKSLHAKALQELQALVSGQRATDRRCCFFKYQDEKDKKKWHLVWTPGFRRKDEQPARPIICTNAACSLLFLERADTTDKCPRCDTKPAARALAGEGGVRKSKLPLALVLLLLIAVLGGAGWWYLNRDENGPENANQATLVVSPETAKITRNGQIEYVATFTDAEGNETDVTTKVSVIVRLKEAENEGNATKFNKAPVRYNISQNNFEAVSVGIAELEFFYFDDEKQKYSATATLEVEPPRNPDTVTILPESVRLGIGTTAQLKMFGEYEDGHKEDLTNAAEWNFDDAGQNGPVIAYKGAVQGMSEGKTKLRARYRATEDSDYVIAEADVNVADIKYQSLNLALASDKVGVGQDPGVSVEVVTDEGNTMSVLGSSLLKLEVEPSDIADVDRHAPYIAPIKPGQGIVRASFGGITKEVPFEVEEADSTKTLAFQVHPENLRLAVGEIADVEVPGQTGLGIVKFASSDLDVVEITPRNRLIGKQPGKATVTVSRGDDEATVAVEVASVPFQGIAFDPSEVSVRVNDVLALRVLGRIDNDTQVELDPQILEWVRFPTDDYVEVNRSALDVRGLRPTGEDQKTITVRLKNHEASAKIRVIPGPSTLALEPSDSIEIPVGQKQTLKVIATYGNGQTEEIPADRVDWNWDDVSGLTFRNGEVTADAAEAGPLTVSASFQGQTTNEVEIRSGPSAPVRLALAANPQALPVGAAGQLNLSAKTPGGQDVSLDLSQVEYASNDDAVAEVDPKTGGFRAMGEGTATLSAKHPSAREAVSVEIRVTPAEPSMPMTPPMPQGVRIVTDAPQPIVLPMGVVFVDVRVEADIDGTVHNVTEDALISIEGDPRSAAIAIRNNTVVGVRPGEAVLKAEFAGQEAKNTLTFQVTDKLELDEIQVGPPNITLAVGENTRMDAIGILDGRAIGVISDHPEVTWKSEKPDVALAEGPVIAAVAPGTAGIVAQFQSVASSPTPVEVVGENSPLPGTLRVEPSAITLRPNESRAIGRDIFVLRGETDLSQQAKVSPANQEVVSYNEDSHSIKAGLPGRTKVIVAVGDETAELDVTVTNEAAPTAGGRVVVEPAGGTIAVAERLPLQIFLVTADGERVNMTESAILNSSDNNVAVTSGSAIRGVAPGTVDISATIPVVDAPGVASFTVENVEFTRIEVNPARIDIAAGERLRFEISVVGPGGRRILGADPDLTLTEILHVDGAAERADVPRHWRQYEGNIPGNHALDVKWRNLETRVPCRVRNGEITGLVIRPADTEIAEGDTLDYLVFAQRGRSLSPLNPVDGVQISVGNSAVASKPAPLRVQGETPGTTEILAEYGNHQARGRLRVGPRIQPVAPAARPVGLRIYPDTFRLELGTSGDLIRVVRLHEDGSTEEVGHLAEITADPEGIVELKDSPSGPVLHPRKIGQTQIHAKLGDLQTQTPMLVEVTDKILGRPRLVVSPNVVRVDVGERTALTRVAVIPVGGGAPVQLPYTVSATDNEFFEVEEGRFIRGTAPGRAMATVTINNPGGNYDKENTTVIVEVEDLATQRVLTNESDLVLRGPTETTEGAEVQFRVDLVNGSAGQQVTAESTLVLDRGDGQYAKLEPGCRLIALKPGTVNVRARYQGRFSDTIRLRINPLSTDFERLELAINTSPLGIGETRGYQVWGHPRGGGPRQDLTRLITTDRMHATHPHIRYSVIRPDANADVAEHTAPNLVGRNPGLVSLQAAIGDRLVSNEERIRVGGEIVEPVDLRVEPTSITSRVGEKTPSLRVLVRAQGDRQYRELDPDLATFTSLDTDVAAPVANDPGRFSAKRPGNTRIRVSYQGLQTGVNVSVVSDLFRSIVLGDPDINLDTFTVPITVTTDLVAGNLEYRVYKQGDRLAANQGWKQTAAQGDSQFVKLTSPSFRLVKNNLFRVVIESRNKATRAIERYPYAFRLGTNEEGMATPE